MTENPLLEPWSNPLGAPPFNKIRSEHFLPAFALASVEAREEFEAIATNAAPADFDNVVAAMERAGAQLSRISRLFWTLSSAQADEGIRSIETDVSSQMTRHATAIDHDPKLFARVAAVWKMRAKLNAEQCRLVEKIYRGFVSGGALLDERGKERFAAINERLGALSVAFGQNVLAAQAGWSMVVDADGCDGLPQSVIDAAERRAVQAGETGFLFTLDRGCVEDFLSFATRRDLRERIWRGFVERGDSGAHDNWPVLEEIVALRRERAQMLGYATFAEEKLEDSMARTPMAAGALLERMWAPALAKALEEQVELQALAGQAIPLKAWDWRFYAEQVRRERYALDGAAVKEHLRLDDVRTAAFACAGKLYGLHFAERPDIAGYHPDVRIWEVKDADDGAVGLLLTDYVARPEKHGGAWMGSLRVQERMDGAVLPIIYTVANFAKAPPPEQTRLSLDEAMTLFHEFGHALHGLLSDVTYPSLSGTSVARDFVELPSKFMEHWIVSPQVLASFGVPQTLIDAIGKADAFGQGFATVELLGSSIVDLAVHNSSDPTLDVKAMAAKTLADLDMPEAIGMRHRLPHFTHVFDGGYAGAYYSYLWSEMLDADVFAAFQERGNIFDPELAGRFRDDILARGDTEDPMALFTAFRGRPPEEQHLLRARGILAI